MYKVLLVDDEPQIRQGLQAKIHWKENGFICCGEASNGKEALQMIDVVRPHVVITDIRMPEMDGVALLKEGMSRYPELFFIVLSGYDDFPYVKAALQYGAKDYLLKPVVRKELIDRLADLRALLDERHERLREQFWLLAVRNNSDPEKWAAEAARFGIEEPEQLNQPMRFVTLGFQDLKSIAQDVYVTVRKKAMLWNEAVYVFRDPAVPELLHLVFGCALHGQEALEEWLYGSFKKSIEARLSVPVQIGVGDPVHAPQDWRKGFISSRLRWMQSVSVAADEAKGSRPTHTEHWELTPILEKQLTSAVVEGDRETLIRLLHSILNTEPPLTLHALYLLALRLLLLFDELAFKSGQPFQETQLLINALPESLWSCRTPKESEELFTRLGTALMEHIQRTTPSSGGESIVRRIEAYLERHYADENISLSDMARRFHLHVTYLSELFKKTTGKNYTEYVTEIRIKKAKELLEHTELRVSDVAEMTGFSNANYFSQVFKKMTGLSPNEYRQRNTRKN